MGYQILNALAYTTDPIIKMRGQRA